MSVEQDNRQFKEDLGNGITLDMVAIPGGTFTMGSPSNEIYSFDDEHLQHQVTVPPFFMGKYPITQAQWRAIASRTDLKVEQYIDLKPAYFKDRPDSNRRPVEQVNWYDAVEFCARLSKLTGREYRLPSEAEWEYACRAGTTTPFYFGETITGELANYNASYTYPGEAEGEYREETTPVGQFPPNAFGLYDMHGNVWEWCADTWHGNYNGAPTDGSVWIENGNNNRSPLRGGSWSSVPDCCRSAIRYDYYRRVFRSDDIGFRVVCVG
jgi:formylglycine-generating enzyme required for sulfatase activity